MPSPGEQSPTLPPQAHASEHSIWTGRGGRGQRTVNAERKKILYDENAPSAFLPSVPCKKSTMPIGSPMTSAYLPSMPYKTSTMAIGIPMTATAWDPPPLEGRRPTLRGTPARAADLSTAAARGPVARGGGSRQRPAQAAGEATDAATRHAPPAGRRRAGAPAAAHATNHHRGGDAALPLAPNPPTLTAAASCGQRRG